MNPEAAAEELKTSKERLHRCMRKLNSLMTAIPKPKIGQFKSAMDDLKTGRTGVDGALEHLGVTAEAEE